MENQNFLLSDCLENELCIVKDIINTDILRQKRMCELGLFNGGKVKYIKKFKDGSGLIEVRGSAFSIDSVIAGCIRVYRGKSVCKK